MCIQWFTLFELITDGVVVLAASLLIEYFSFQNEVHYSPLFQYYHLTDSCQWILSYYSSF